MALAARPPGRQAAPGEGRPVGGEVGRCDLGKSGATEIGGEGLHARQRRAEEDLAHVAFVGRGERPAPVEILEIELAPGLQRAGHARGQARPLGNMQEGAPADRGIERGIGKRAGKRIAADMGDALR